MSELLKYLSALPQPAQVDFASRCNTTINALRKGVYAKQRFGIEKCVVIAVQSGGAVKPSHLRPDINWLYIRDALVAIEQTQSLSGRVGQGVVP